MSLEELVSGWPKFWSMMLSFHSRKILFGWLMGTILAFAMAGAPTNSFVSTYFSDDTLPLQTMSGVQREFMDRLTYLRLEADTLRSSWRRV